jgi:hypothetical protein
VAEPDPDVLHLHPVLQARLRCRATSSSGAVPNINVGKNLRWSAIPDPRTTSFRAWWLRPKNRFTPSVAARFYSLADDRFLQTLLITTSYSGGRIVPALGMFYDWQGAMVFQPGVQLVRDPFRFIVDYTALIGAPTGQFGAVRDRDNVRMQVEFVF